MNKQIDKDENPVTVVAEWKIKPEKQKGFENWIKGINQEVAKCKGYVGTDVIRPENPAANEYVIIIKFDTYKHLKKWIMSKKRAEWIDKSQRYRKKEPKIQRVTGLEYWFNLPMLE